MQALEFLETKICLNPSQYAFKYTGSSWDWYEEPGNELRLKRFTAAMHGSTKTEHPDGILHGEVPLHQHTSTFNFTHHCVMAGFRWGDLPPKSVVVDVGGGLGHVTMRIAREYPDLRYIVQDRVAIIEQAEEVCHPSCFELRSMPMLSR